MAPRTELLALLQHVKDDLDDDTRRLVLADWLEEHGDAADQARAARLRRWIEHTSQKNSTPPPRFRLTDPLRKAWYGPLLGLKCDIREITTGLLSVSAASRSLITKAGLAAVGSEALAWVSHLTISSGEGPAVGKLVDADLLPGVVSLSFANCGIRADGAGHLARLSADIALRELHLDGCWIEHSGVKRLMKAKWLPHLHGLDLYRNMIWPDSIGELAAAPLDSLRWLRLGHHRLQDGIGHLARAKWLPSLEDLDLASEQFTEAGLRRLLTEGNVSGLTYLRLGSVSDLTPASLDMIGRAATLTRLETLEVCGGGFRDEGLTILTRTPLFGRLRHLNLGTGASQQRAYER